MGSGLKVHLGGMKIHFLWHCELFLCTFTTLLQLQLQFTTQLQLQQQHGPASINHNIWDRIGWHYMDPCWFLVLFICLV